MATDDLPTSRLPRWRRNLRLLGDRGTIYTPLNSDKQEFRVLLLYAGSGEDRVKAELYLTRFEANQQQKYETISYCWGDPNKAAKIRLNGKTTTVPTSCAAALRCVRLLDRNRIVWIDALCIIQSDLDERAQQVAIMADIYSKSSGNLVYLGEADSLTEQALQGICKIMTDIKQRTRDFSVLEGSPFATQNADDSCYEDIAIHVDEEALRNFFSKHWFQRVWAFQEAALAPTNICFIGHCRIDLSNIVRTAQWITYHPTSYSSDMRANRGVVAAFMLQRFADKAFGIHHNHGPGLAHILVTSLYLQATEPRDHVYGLLGLWNLRKGTSQSPPNLTPDYRKPVNHLFRDATRAALEERNNLSLCKLVSHLDDASLCSDVSPSWVIDLGQNIDAFYYAVNPKVLPRGWCADNKLQLLSSTTSPLDLDLILLSGFRLDQVIDVGSVLNLLDSTIYDKVKSWALNLVATIRKYVEEASFEDIGTIVAAGHNRDGERTTIEDAHSFDDLLHALSNEDRALLPRPKISGSVSDQELATSRYWTQVKSVCLNRRVFVTNTGYIGIGPRVTRAGDDVVVLYGGQTPFVLRPDNDEYRLAGACYVHGVMDGEAMRRHKDSGDPDIEFTIR